MGPAAATGTFLRTWRAEWAGLSRAQLAIAVSSGLPTRKAVSTKVIRKWEEGQPPKSTEELEALCKVMRRHGVTAFEVEDYRKAVFSACVDRQYPELFPEEDFARREDVDEVARQLWGGAWSWNPRRNPVAVVAALEALREDAGRRMDSGGPPVPRRQWAAAAYLQAALAHIHKSSRRWALGRRMLEVNSELLMDQFGGVLETRLTAPMNRGHWLNWRAYEGECEPWVVRELLYTYRELAAPDTRSLPGHGPQLRGFWLDLTVDSFAFHGGAEYFGLVRGLEAEHFALCLDAGPHTYASYQHGTCAWRDGRWADAERHRSALEHLQGGADHERFMWLYWNAKFACARGDHAEALEHVPQARALASRLGNSGAEGQLDQVARECEDALRAARLRRPNGNGGTPGQPTAPRKRRPRRAGA